MKFVFSAFFKTLRLALGPVMLLWEIITRPKGLVRAPAKQAQVDQACKSLVLYQYKTCPFCLKVRQEMARLSLNIERRDAQHNASNRAELVDAVGKAKVPCLKVTDPAGHSEWLLDSKAIMAYLQGRFASQS
jgi:glutaredoxin